MPVRTSLPHDVAGRIVFLPGADPYRLQDASRLLTPALLVYPDLVGANVGSIVSRLDHDPSRWRAHVKSAKLQSVMHQLVGAGVTHLKCATTLELRVACAAGARDALLAYPTVGPKAERVKALAREAAGTAVSALIEDAASVDTWRGSPVGLFVDVNPGMNRTGIPDTAVDRILSTVRAIDAAGLRFAGLHYYDGHVGSLPADTAEQSAHRGYDRLLRLVDAVEHAGIRVPEIITAGTPALPFTLSYQAFRTGAFVHRASPGTVVYNDLTSIADLPPDWGLVPAAIVAATVVSHPAPGIITCDAGHKSVSADAGVPTCVVLGRPDLQPQKPSEEHLPIVVPAGSPRPEVGDLLYLVPRHVCPTVNNFDAAVIVRDGIAIGVEGVAARGHEGPMAQG